MEDVKSNNVQRKISFEKLMKTGRLDIPLSNGKNLKLSGNPAGGDLSFKVTNLGNEKNVFLKGSLEDAFNEKKKVMVKLGVKI